MNSARQMRRRRYSDFFFQDGAIGRAFPSHGRGRRFNLNSAHQPIHCLQ